MTDTETSESTCSRPCSFTCVPSTATASPLPSFKAHDSLTTNSVVNFRTGTISGNGAIQNGNPALIWSFTKTSLDGSIAGPFTTTYLLDPSVEPTSTSNGQIVILTTNSGVACLTNKQITDPSNDVAANFLQGICCTSSGDTVTRSSGWIVELGCCGDPNEPPPEGSVLTVLRDGKACFVPHHLCYTGSGGFTFNTSMTNTKSSPLFIFSPFGQLSDLPYVVHVRVVLEGNDIKYGRKVGSNTLTCEIRQGFVVYSTTSGLHNVNMLGNGSYDYNTNDLPFSSTAEDRLWLSAVIGGADDVELEIILNVTPLYRDFTWWRVCYEYYVIENRGACPPLESVPVKRQPIRSKVQSAPKIQSRNQFGNKK